MTAAAAGMGETDLFLDMGGADFPAVLGQYVGETFTIPPPPPLPPPAVPAVPTERTVYRITSHGVKPMEDSEAVKFTLTSGLTADVANSTELDPRGANLWVRAPVQTGPGYQDGTEWRLPVTINLETLAKI